MDCNQQLDRDGYFITPSLLSSREISNLIRLIESEAADPNRGGIRDIMKRIPALEAVAEHPNVRTIVDTMLSTKAFVVRSTLFDKTPKANWKVSWHQDVTIAVRERIDTPGYGPWSIKEGIHHVQPPTEVLARMLTIRIHLDDCPASNGALRVMPGTHHLGRIHQNDAPKHVNEAAAITCEVEAGGALVMRPLLLHASSASDSPAHRRVLHFDFANTSLASGLGWRFPLPFATL